ncbi:MAG: murein biosynthesis integral membrane protein MurJ [Syntrophomonas sp.]
MNDNGKRVAKAALLLMITVVISRILGYGREVALYSLFGQNYITDAYRAAFSIPDFIYLMLVGGGLSSAFIPVFSGLIATGREEEGWKSASIVFNYVIIFLFLLIAVAYFFTGSLINLLAPGLPPTYASLAVGLTHIMFIQTFFMALNGLAMGVLNSHNRFAAPAIGSLVYNLVIILIGIAFFKEFGIAAFSYGVVIGAILNFIVQIPALRKVGMKYYFSFDSRNEGFRQIMVLLIPVIAGLGVVQVNLFVTQNLSSGIGPGMIGALNLAQKLMNLPLGIFAVSIGTAVFPTMTMLMAKGELAAFKRTTSLGTRAVFLVTIPASLGLMAVGEPVLKLLFEQGKFTSSMVSATSQALTYYCVGLFAYAALQVLNRSFYALKDTLTPVIAAVITIGLNILMSINLVGPMGHRGLALAYSLAGIFNLLFLLVVLRVKIGKIGVYQISGSFLISLAASAVMFFAVRFTIDRLLEVLTWHDKINLLVSVSAAMAVGVGIYAIIIYMFRLEEFQLVLQMARKKLHRA